MARFSNAIIVIINGVILIVSILILRGGIWLATKGNSGCDKFLQWPVICIGVFLILLSMAGFYGAYDRVLWQLWVYLFFMFVLIILLFCFTVFTFVVTNKGAGQVLSNRAFKEYRLGDYSDWLQKRVDNPGNWKDIQSCIQDAMVCQRLADHTINETAQEFYSQDLSPIESGCCKPPTSCNFTFVTATTWIADTSLSVNTTNPDCGLWSNYQNQLCYNCNACKAGVVATLKHDWREITIFNFISLVVLIVVYSIACCTFRHSNQDNGRDGYPE